MIDVGVVLEVGQRANAVFLEVELRHYTNAGASLRALVRWSPPYHGEGFGSWWVPSIGADVLCLFPGLGTDGRAEDLDEGYAVAVVSSDPEPPVAGLVGALATNRRVFKGRPGEAQDDHFQGAHDHTIDGPQTQRLKSTRSTTIDGAETRYFKATRAATVDGTETRETKGVFSWLYRAAATFLGDALVRIASQAEVRVDAPIVRLGTETAIKKIVHEEFLALFNAHTHSGVEAGPDTTGPPTAAAVAGAHTSTRTRVDG